ncbi:MAG: hypothetical protein GY871_10980 [Actinomycetales bacterium]|nr:hypothetical protein [Actinomycetales bacterium]MCP4895003.1 hypothetical protein [Actinomycetales bacterium]
MSRKSAIVQSGSLSVADGQVWVVTEEHPSVGGTNGSTLSHVPMWILVIVRESRETASHGFANGGGTYLVTLSHRTPKTAYLCHGVITHTTR